jgi:hypothetical protein
MDRSGGQTLGEYFLILMLAAVAAAVIMGASFGDRVSGLIMRVVGSF